MDKHIPIDYDYGRIVLEFTKQPERHLTPTQWGLLASVEKNSDPDMVSYTSVVDREFETLAKMLWDRAEDHRDDLGTDTKNEREVARRVAAALAIIAFGTDWLLKL